VTRPSMMLFLPLAALLLAAVEWKRSGLQRGTAAAALFVMLWMAVVVPVTIRNYIMSGDPVLITSGQGQTFIDYNLPSGDRHYRLAFDGTMRSVATTLFQIFLDHPREFLSNLGTKLGFSLGMVHWMGSGIKPHPELLITTFAYLLALVVIPAARSVPALPVHLFVLTHLATLMLSMPSNYGYRLLLPMYLFMPAFAGVLAERALGFLAARRS
jgi:hypothetical protein